MATRPATPSSTQPDPAARLIFALDVPDPEEALLWVKRLQGTVRHWKVGLELFFAGGWEIVHEVGRHGPVFLDLKLLDIPATVGRALQQVSAHAEVVRLITLHGINQVQVSAAQLDPRLRVLTVPVLTSLTEADLHATGVKLSLSDYFLRLTETSRALGCHGVIAAGAEIRAVRARFGPGFLIVVPGVRPSWTQVRQDDQQRVIAPGEAIAAGADYLVVGRAIRDAADPLAAARRIQDEMAAAAR